MSRLASLVTLLAAAAVAQGRFVPAGALATGRTGHTATVLPDGRVLVVGGRPVDGLGLLASTELFDPRKGTWTAGPALATARAGHTASLLPDGRVLVAGGTTLVGDADTSRFVSTASVELLDARRSRWRPGPPLAEPRNGHTATVLGDGSVLVVGGLREKRTRLASVERFDGRAWRPVAPLSLARWLHAAVALDDGTVVVMGGRQPHPDGEGPGATTDTAERFLPDGGWWAPVPAMSEPRQRMGAVAMAGGAVVVGGQTGSSATNLAEVWSPGQPGWTGLDASLSMALSSHSATVLPSGDLLIIGGEPPTAVDTARAQRWSRARRTWCLAGELSTGRKGHTASLLKDGRVLVVGGTASGVPERQAELWVDGPGECQEPPGLEE